MKNFQFRHLSFHNYSDIGPMSHIRNKLIGLLTRLDIVVVVAVVYLHDITTYINIREISQMNHANKDLKEVKNL